MRSTTTRYLTRRRESYIFQIRIPHRINRLARLGPLRLTLGPMGRREAREQADMLAGRARMVFSAIREPLRSEDRTDLMTAIFSATGKKADRRIEDSETLDERETMFRMAFHDLRVRLGNIENNRHRHLDSSTEITARVLNEDFSAWAKEMAGNGILRRTLTPAEWMELCAALTDEKALRRRFALTEIAGEATDFGEMRNSLMGDIEYLLRKVPVRAADDDAAPASGRRRVKLFSEAAALLMKEIGDENGTSDHPDVAIIQRVSNYFIAMKGDRRVDKYDFDDIQDYANDLAYIKPNIFKKDAGLTLQELKKHIAETRESKEPGLSYSTIKNTYLDRVRRVIKRGCRDARVTDRLGGEKIRIPKRAMPTRTRSPIPFAKTQDVFRKGVESGLLSDIMLPLLGWITGRRIGLLAQLQTTWFSCEGGVWLVAPQWHIDPKKIDERIGLKSEASRKRFVVHKVLEDIGFLGWVSSRPPGPVFEILSACADPEDAAQKRMGRIFAAAGLDKDRMQTFHALRNTWISENSLKLEGRVSRIQAGHELHDIHDDYKGNLTPAEAKMLYGLPLPGGFDVAIFQGIDWDLAAAKKPKGGRRAKVTVKVVR